jgi:hypothetical protein
MVIMTRQYGILASTGILPWRCSQGQQVWPKPAAPPERSGAAWATRASSAPGPRRAGHLVSSPRPGRHRGPRRAGHLVSGPAPACGNSRESWRGRDHPGQGGTRDRGELGTWAAAPPRPAATPARDGAAWANRASVAPGPRRVGHLVIRPRPGQKHLLGDPTRHGPPRPGRHRGGGDLGNWSAGHAPAGSTPREIRLDTDHPGPGGTGDRGELGTWSAAPPLPASTPGRAGAAGTTRARAEPGPRQAGHLISRPRTGRPQLKGELTTLARAAPGTAASWALGQRPRPGRPQLQREMARHEPPGPGRHRRPRRAGHLDGWPHTGRPQLQGELARRGPPGPGRHRGPRRAGNLVIRSKVVDVITL